MSGFSVVDEEWLQMLVDSCRQIRWLVAVIERDASHTMLLANEWFDALNATWVCVYWDMIQKYTDSGDQLAKAPSVCATVDLRLTGIHAPVSRLPHQIFIGFAEDSLLLNH